MLRLRTSLVAGNAAAPAETALLVCVNDLDAYAAIWLVLHKTQ